MNKKLKIMMSKIDLFKLREGKYWIDCFYGRKLHTDIAPCITTRNCMANNDWIVEVINGDSDGCCRTIRSSYYKAGKANLIPQNDGYVETEIIEKKVLGWTRDKKGHIVNWHDVKYANTICVSKRDDTMNYVMEESKVVGKTKGNYDMRDRIYSEEGCSPTIRTCQGGGLEPKIAQVRIRKLTERECLRLMGVSDNDIDKLVPHLSKSQLYKLAGNSIVVDVLSAIFHNLLINNEVSEKQLKLF